MADQAQRPYRFPPGLVLPLAAIAVWCGLAATGALTGPLAVTPMQALTVSFADPSGRELWPALLASLARVLAGGLLGGAAGLVLGYVTGTYRLAALSMAPSIHAVRQVALFAWIPLLTSWFGNGEATKVVFTALSAFFPLFLATEQGIRNTPSALIEVAEVLTLRDLTRIYRLYLPAALPTILMGLQIATLSTWLGTVSAEYAIGNGRGLGSYMATARDQFRMDIVLVGVVTLAVSGAALTGLVRSGAKLMTPWKQQP